MYIYIHTYIDIYIYIYTRAPPLALCGELRRAELRAHPRCQGGDIYIYIHAYIHT